MKREEFKGLTKTQVKGYLRVNTKLGKVLDKEFAIEAFKWLYGVEGWNFKTNKRELVDVIIKPSGMFGTKCHYLVFSNGETTDISINGERSHIVDVSLAMRNAIEPSMNEIR